MYKINIYHNHSQNTKHYYNLFDVDINNVID